MKKIPIFVAVWLAAGTSLSAETVPSLVVGHYYGVDTYPVSLDDFNRIEIGDHHYTLKANNSNVKDQTLSYSQYPRFWVEDVEKDNIVTSQEQIEESIMDTLIIYSSGTRELRALNGEAFTATLFNVGAQIMLRAAAGQGEGISVASLPEGIYIAQARIAGETITIKFVKH